MKWFGYEPIKIGFMGKRIKPYEDPNQLKFFRDQDSE